MDYLTTGEVSQILDIGEHVISRWVKDGIINPARAANGKGNRHVFGLRDVLAVGIGRDLRKRGFSLSQAAHIMEWLFSQSIENLEEQWDLGKNLLLAVGEKSIHPRLLSSADVYENELVEAFQSGVAVAIIDIEKCHQLVIEKLQEIKIQAERPSHDSEKE